MTKPATAGEIQDEQLILDIITRLKDQPGALLPMLHNIQSALGFVPEAAVPLIARVLNISRADVHGVISFYHHFRSTKPGNYVIQVCRAESCQAMGSRVLEQHVKKTLAIDYHQTTKNGNFTLEPVYCLGNCACSPSIAIANDVYGEMNEEKFDQLIDSLSDSLVKRAGAA